MRKLLSRAYYLSWLVLLLVFSFTNCHDTQFDPDDFLPEEYNGEVTFILNGEEGSTKGSVIESRRINPCFASIRFGTFNLGNPESSTLFSRVNLCDGFLDTVSLISIGSESLSEEGPPIGRHFKRDGDILLALYGLDTTAHNWIVIEDLEEDTDIVTFSFEASFITRSTRFPSILDFQKGRGQVMLTRQ